jgi:endonuclease/exonuclease/phosphatase family metal-dependent hydrolase
LRKRSGFALLKILNRLGLFARLLFFTNILLAVCTFLGYLCIHISPTDFWPGGFFTLSIPVMLIIHIIFILVWLLRKQFKNIIPSLLVITAGYPLISRTFTFHSTELIPLQQTTFEVMSYNVRTFNNAAFYEKKNRKIPDEIINWLARQPADIKCIQEFFHLDKSTIFNSINKINYNGQYNYFMTPFSEQLRAEKGFYGLAIFTRFPIVNSGEILFERRSVNKGIFADVIIGHDTLRILNIHLQSHKIKPDSLFDKADYEESKEEYKNLYKQLKKGFISHGSQTQLIEKAIQESPYPVILCGDFNDTPYSYAYQQIRKYLDNAFEEKGNGFGFTYNGRLFFGYLRIDNQFFDKKYKIFEYKTWNEIKYSDHFPITARYGLK